MRFLRRAFFALAILLAASSAFAAYTEFFTTKGAGASDLNGGGPRLGANDAPIAVCTDASVIAGSLTTVVDNTAGNWAGVIVDDWIVIDTAGAKELRRVSALAPGGDATKITIASAATACANKDCHIGGAWATVDFMMSTLSSTTINAASNIPRGNIKYSASAYSEQATVDNSFTSRGIIFEGYEATPGDACPTGNLPLISSNATGITGGIVCAKGYTVLRWLRVEMSGAGIHAINAAAGQVSFENLRLKATGAGAYGLVNTSSGNYVNIYVEDSASDGIVLTGGVAMHCTSMSSGRYGITSSSAAGTVLVGCVVGAPADDAFALTGYYWAMINCTAYGSVAGSGLRYTYGAYGSSVRGCTFAQNNQYGIETPNFVYAETEDFNAYYANGVNETLNVLPNSGATAHVGLHSVTLSGDPFVNAAGGNFALNATAGAGAACRAAGFPGTLLDGVNIGYADIGALRHQDAGGLLINPGMTGGTR